MYVNAVDVFGVNVAADVSAFLDDEDGLRTLPCLMRKNRTSEAGAYYEIIIHIDKYSSSLWNP